jgi:hypothetical protein
MQALKKANLKKALLCAYKGAAHVLSRSASDRLHAFQYTSLDRSNSVMDFFKNQNHLTVPKPWLHSAIPNMHHTNIVQYNTDSVDATCVPLPAHASGIKNGCKNNW